MQRLNGRFLLVGASASAFLAALIAGCSSSPGTPENTESCTAGTTVACTCAGGATGSQLCGAPTCTCSDDAGATSSPDAGKEVDASEPVDAGPRNGDGGHVDDGAPPGSLYGACAVKGSFGWPCTEANAIDPTSCTDPKFPYCFGGGQGYWCTADCADAGFASACAAEATGCAPTACNAKGYCK